MSGLGAGSQTLELYMLRECAISHSANHQLNFQSLLEDSSSPAASRLDDLDKQIGMQNETRMLRHLKVFGTHHQEIPDMTGWLRVIHFGRLRYRIRQAIRA